VLLGLVPLIIPGLILSCALAVSLEACVAEGLDPVDSLKRSAELTKGNRMQIFGFSLALIFISGFLSAAAELIAGLFTDNQILTIILGYILSMPVHAYATIAYIVLYRFLVNSGAAGGERLSRIFN